MSDKNFAIPGFMTPGTPHEDRRIYAHPNGDIVWDIIQVDNSTLLPIEIIMSFEYGSQKTKRLVLDPKQITLMNIANDDGIRIIRAFIPVSCISAEPGTYVLRAMHNGEEINSKNLVIKAHPTNQGSLENNRFNDDPIVLKPDLSD